LEESLDRFEIFRGLSLGDGERHFCVFDEFAGVVSFLRPVMAV
jgi:hypothetical protein